MTRTLTIAFALVLLGVGALPAQEPSQWLSWRGPQGNGITENQDPVTQWTNEQNVIWKSKVPGKGHASPTIVGNKIILATADNQAQTQSVVCYDRANGEKLWEIQIHEGNLNPRIHPKNTQASATIASDGTHAFAVFNNNGGVWLTALDLDGKQVWQKEVGKFRPAQYQFGYGCSPSFMDGKLFVTSESEADPFILALDPATGEQIYRVERPKATSYSTPVVANVAGKKQLLMSGGRSVKGYDADTGEELWSANTPWVVSCGTMVWDENLAFASGGFPRPQTIAVDAGTGEVAWTNQVKCYEQSMIVVDGYLYGLSDRGICYCWRAKDGKEMWKSRMENPISASPVYAGGNLYFTIENGKTFVIKANPEAFELVSTNQLGDRAFATPTFLDNLIFTRVGDGSQEWLYCLGSN